MMNPAMITPSAGAVQGPGTSATAPEADHSTTTWTEADLDTFWTKANVEALLIALSLFVFVGYNVWLIALRPMVAHLGRSKNKRFHVNDFFAAGKLGRSIFTEQCASDPKEAILAVQQARNAMTASSYLATVSSILATAGITILLEPAKTQRIQELAMKDPILRNFPGDPLTNPEIVLMCALCTLYGSFVCFGQSVRLYVHWGYYVRCVSSEFNRDALHMDDARLVVIRAGMAFTIGMRLFFMFVVLILWSGGVTWMLIASLVITTFLYSFDSFDNLSNRGSIVEQAREEVLEELAKLERGEVEPALDDDDDGMGGPVAARRAVSWGGPWLGPGAGVRVAARRAVSWVPGRAVRRVEAEAGAGSAGLGTMGPLLECDQQHAGAA